jgi:hypothetical protein
MFVQENDSTKRNPNRPEWNYGRLASEFDRMKKGKITQHNELINNEEKYSTNELG